MSNYNPKRKFRWENYVMWQIKCYNSLLSIFSIILFSFRVLCWTDYVGWLGWGGKDGGGIEWLQGWRICWGVREGQQVYSYTYLLESPSLTWATLGTTPSWLGLQRPIYRFTYMLLMSHGYQWNWTTDYGSVGFHKYISSYSFLLMGLWCNFLKMF